MEIDKLLKIDYIFAMIKKSGTKDAIKQMIYVVEELGEVSECLRCIHGDFTKDNKTKEDLFNELGDLFITIMLIAKFEKIDISKLIDNGINHQFNKWINLFKDKKELIE